MAQRVQLTATVSENQLGQRLDQALAEMFPDYSRSRIKEWILDQRVLVNGKVCDKPKEKVLGGEQVAINAEIEEEARFEPQDIPLDIVYEDEDIIVINPGSLSYPRQEGRRATYVMMEIDKNGEAHFELEYV